MIYERGDVLLVAFSPEISAATIHPEPNIPVNITIKGKRKNHLYIWYIPL